MKVYDMLQAREQVELAKVSVELERLEGRKIITLIEPEYPEFLKKIYKPPFIVELEGNKVYYVYGKDLAKRFEIRQPKNDKDLEAVEKEYIKNLDKVCK